MSEFIQQGGVVMYPLLAFSIIALAIILERSFYFGRIRREIPEKIIHQVKVNIQRGDTKKALALFKHAHNPVYRILAKGISVWEKGSQEMEREMEEVKMLEFPRMERRLPMLYFIGKMSPSLGLLGTVIGMIKTFHFLSLNVESQQLAQGISEALTTTAFGLIISIPSLAVYYYLMNKLEQVITHSEKREIELINYAQKIGNANAQIQD
jgi:biopolymer transport protein ExbB